MNNNDLLGIVGAAGKLWGPLIVSSGHLWAERRSAAGHLFSSQLVSLYNVLMTLYSTVYDWLVLRAGPVSLLAYDLCSIFVFNWLLFFFILFIRWFCGTGVFGLIERLSRSYCLAMSFFKITIIIVFRVPNPPKNSCSETIKYPKKIKWCKVNNLGEQNRWIYIIYYILYYILYIYIFNIFIEYIFIDPKALSSRFWLTLYYFQALRFWSKSYFWNLSSPSHSKLVRW